MAWQARDSKYRNAKVLLDKLKSDGRLTLEAIGDHFVDKEIIIVPGNLRRQFIDRETRAILGRIRRLDDPKSGKFSEWVAIPGKDEEEQQVFGFIKEIKEEEASDICNSAFMRYEKAKNSSGKQVEKRLRELHHYVDAFNSTLGKSFQRQLPFELPSLPKPPKKRRGPGKKGGGKK